jgi:RNA-directed DNA polymerase
MFVLQGENCMSAIKAMNMRKRVYTLQSKLSNAAKESLDRKFGAVYDKVYREDVLMESWRLVRANKGAPGVDEQDFETIERDIGVERFLAELGADLRAKRYRPKPVLRCWIDKPGKAEKRPLGIPAIRDRVAQMAAKLILEPIFETESSFLKRALVFTVLARFSSGVKLSYGNRSDTLCYNVRQIDNGH